MEYKKSISKDEINTLPPYEYPGKIKVIATEDEARKAATTLREYPVLGFDTESRPAFQKGQNYPVSLLQLATPDTTYLFRLNTFPLIDELAEILSDDKIIKAGLAVRDDVKGLQKLRYFESNAFLDLAIEAERRGFLNQGLRGLTALFLGKKLSKGAKLTNWSQPRLTPAQIHYAASDAAVCLEIYEILKDI